MTITTSASSATTRPISGRLLAVAVAAGAEDADHAARAQLARGVEHVLERARLVRVVDEHRERLALVDRLEPARDAVDRLDAPLDRVLADPERARGRGRGERVLELKRPRSASSQLAERVVARRRR